MKLRGKISLQINDKKISYNKSYIYRSRYKEHSQEEV